SFLFGRADEVVRRGVESFLVVIGAEIVSRAFVDGLGRSFWIDIHSTDWADRMFGGGNRNDSVGLIGIRVHPALSLIFHVVGSFLGDVAAEVALDYPEREIDPRRKSASRREISVFNET